MGKTEFQKLRSLDAKLDNWLREQEKKQKNNKRYEDKKREQLDSEENIDGEENN